MFHNYKLWDCIDKCYGALHLSDYESSLKDIMTHDMKGSTAELILTDAIDDYSKATGRSIEELRNDIIESGAYDALFNFDTGLWKEGPDYFIDFYQSLPEATINA